MSEVKIFDLDLHAAEFSQTIIDNVLNNAEKLKSSDTENLITKALGVLQENGVYACALFLYARTSSDNKIAAHVRNGLLQMTSQLGLAPPQNAAWQDGLKFVSGTICDDLDRLLLVRQLWEQTLIYARYGAKAWGEKEKEEKREKEKQSRRDNQ